MVEQRDSTKSINGENNRWLVWFESPADLTNGYRSSLKVEPVKEYASVFTLSFNGYSPQQGADYLNKLMELYITSGTRMEEQGCR